MNVKTDFEHAAVSDKLKALLVIAGKTAGAASTSRRPTSPAPAHHGATDLEIHDTVLIAAVFCMCNRYVDGLATWAPDDPAFYRQRAALVAANGYAASTITASASPPSRRISQITARKRSHVQFPLAAVLLCLLAAPAAFCPGPDGRHRRRHHRSDGRRVTGAHVVAKNLDTGFQGRIVGRRRASSGVHATPGRVVQPDGGGSPVCALRAGIASGQRQPDGARGHQARGRHVAESVTVAGRVQLVEVDQRPSGASSPAARSSICRSTAATSRSSGCCRLAWRR